MRPLTTPLLIATLSGCAISSQCLADALASAVAVNRQWVEQSFSPTPAAPVPTDRFTITHEDVPGDTKVGRCGFGTPLRLGDEVYTRGIGVNSHSVMHMSLTRPAASFRALIGLDRNVDGTPASVRFHVAADGTEVFVTEIIRAGAPPRGIDVPLAGATDVDLTVDDGGDGRGWDQGDWVNAREYITEYLDAAIKGYGLSWLRIDYNIDPGGFWAWRNGQDPDRVGMAEMRYVEGLYRLWDDLLAANPGLRIDNCASGGRRIDLETCRRSTPLWRSDNTCDMVGSDPARILHAAIKNQVMSAGLNRYLPFNTVGQMGADPYRFRSGFNGGIDFAEDLRVPGYPREELRQAILEGKRIRPFWLGDFYNLSPVSLDPTAWCVLQYHRPAQGDGIVLGFRRDESAYTGYECALRGIDPAARYEVTVSHSYTPEAPVAMAGAELAKLRLEIGERPGSVLVGYRRLP